MNLRDQIYKQIRLRPYDRGWNKVNDKLCDTVRKQLSLQAHIIGSNQLSDEINKQVHDIIQPAILLSLHEQH